MKKIILAALGALLVAGIVIAIVMAMRPQTITFKDGTTLTLLGATYGKHHTPPKISGKRLRSSSIDTTNDSLVVWVKTERKKSNDQNWPNYQLFVSDTADTGCVGAWSASGSGDKGVYVQGFRIDGYPRRDRKIVIRVGTWGNTGRMQVPKEQFVVSNPGKRSFVDWTPEPLPDTQSDGDLTVTLTKCVAGYPGFGNYGTPKSVMNKAVYTAYHFEQNGHVATNWQPVTVETSDATGNAVRNNSWSNSQDQNGDQILTYQWGLWPNEKAWKLKVEFSRTSGFNDNELWTVTNVPVKTGKQMDFWNYENRRKTNSPVAETTLNGIHLRLYPATIFTDSDFNGGKMGGFRIIANPPPPDGYRMTLISATDEAGHKIDSWNSGGGDGNYGFQLQNMRNAKSLNITIALHKSRFTEFTVKPTKP